MLIAAQLITGIAVNTVTDNAYNNIFENLQYADSNLNIFLEDASAIGLSIMSNQKTIITGLEDDSPEASYSAFLVQKEVEAYLRNIIANKNHILMTAIIGLDGKSFQSGGSLILKRTILEPWFTETLQNSGTRIFYNTPDFRHILVCRPIIYDSKARGVAVVEMNYQVLNGLYGSAPLSQCKITAFDDAGNVVFSNYDFRDIRTMAQTDLGPLINSYNAARKYWNINGKRALIVRYQSSFNKLTTMGYVNYSSLTSAAWQINSLMLVIVAASVAAAALAAWFFSRVFCRNIYRLQESMVRIREGNIEVRSRIKSRDEIGVMADIFNNMMDRIGNLLKNIQKTEEQKRLAEQTVLEAQIQPHFIYNTINSIAYVAHERGEKDLEAVASSTVQLLRGVLGVRESFIPLWQEYDYIEHYLTIQRFKMGRDFRLEWDVEEKLWSYPIPKLLLQPIVENALLHGIAQKKDGRISVQVFLRNETFVMKVTDNGRGLVSQPEEKSGGSLRKVGLHNVRERINLIYGEGYGVEITSVPDAFTSVELILPFRENTPCSV